jgi:hypothetical protein
MGLTESEHAASASVTHAATPMGNKKSKHREEEEKIAENVTS